MHPLRFSLSSIPEKGLTLNVRVSEDDLRPEGVGSLDIQEVVVSGLLEELNGSYLFRGTVTGTYRRACDRCFVPVERAFSSVVCWTFEQGTIEDPWSRYDRETRDVSDEEVDSSVGYFVGDELDMSSLTWEEVVLALPLKCLCRDDCAGLCPRCGQNLNEVTCDCAAVVEREKAEESGFARLREMFPGLKSDTASKEE